MARERLLHLLGSEYPRLHARWNRFALSRVLNPVDALDVVQDAVERTLRANPLLDTAAALDAYVIKTIRRVTIDYWRQRATRAQHTPVGARRPDIVETVSAWRLRNDQQSRSHEVAIAMAKTESLRLPAELQEAIDLYYLRDPGAKLHEIAAVQGVSEATAQRRVQRGLEMLRNAFGRAGGE